MKILIFLHGTIIMHKNATGKTREEIVRQSKGFFLILREKSVCDYKSYIPIGNAVEKLKSWQGEGAEILYLSSHKNIKDVKKDKFVLEKHGFPDGQVFFRQKREQYKDVAEKIIPDVLIEDDCESIGGKKEMTITNVESEVKNKIKSIAVKEFGGINHLPDKISELLKW
jgi:hypothetical protein